MVSLEALFSMAHVPSSSFVKMMRAMMYIFLSLHVWSCNQETQVLSSMECCMQFLQVDIQTSLSHGPFPHHRAKRGERVTTSLSPLMEEEDEKLRTNSV
jgi:hypothetical protein